MLHCTPKELVHCEEGALMWRIKVPAMDMNVDTNGQVQEKLLKRRAKTSGVFSLAMLAAAAAIVITVQGKPVRNTTTHFLPVDYTCHWWDFTSVTATRNNDETMTFSPSFCFSRFLIYFHCSANPKGRRCEKTGNFNGRIDKSWPANKVVPKT